VTLVVLVPGVAPAQPKHGPKPKRELVVMTRNLYLGASLDAAVAADTPLEFLIAVATIYGTVQFTDFPARAQALAVEIAESDPDLVGLQEVANWIATGPGAPPSLDFLAILQQALADRGLSYSVASVSNNANIGPVPLALCGDSPPSCTLTFQDRDVILVNDDARGLRTFHPRSGLYEAQLVVDTSVGPLSFSRGWASIDGRLQGKKFRFLNTHLETGAAPEVQEAQAREFLRGPARSPGAVIAVGDFNSAADGSTTQTYAILTKSFFRDAWAETRANEPGFTCCQNETLSNPVSLLAERIDLVLTHAAVRPLDADIIGDEPFQATPPLWASDHAGVVAALRVH
jgi:endonuclease/exonuclease/phosphatase family metal-dependent hydrolase